MKINELIKAVKPMFLDLGFTYFPHKRTWSGGIFCKKEPNNMYLTIGLTIDRFIDCNYTVDLYYSTVTKIGSVYGDIPFECSSCPDWILTKEDRKKLGLPKEPEALWWDSTDFKTINIIKETITISEERLLKNKGLIDKVKKSANTKKLQNISSDIIDKVNNINPYFDCLYDFAPTKTTNAIPVKWFQAAEIVCKKYYDKINKNCVYWSAGDAYRIYTLSKLYRGV